MCSQGGRIRLARVLPRVPALVNSSHGKALLPIYIWPLQRRALGKNAWLQPAACGKMSLGWPMGIQEGPAHTPGQGSLVVHPRAVPEPWGMHIPQLATSIFIVICRATADIPHSFESLSAVCKHLPTPYEEKSFRLIFQTRNVVKLTLLWNPSLPNSPICPQI